MIPTTVAMMTAWTKVGVWYDTFVSDNAAFAPSDSDWDLAPDLHITLLLLLLLLLR